jgi:hypothetical protein
MAVPQDVEITIKGLRKRLILCRLECETKRALILLPDCESAYRIYLRFSDFLAECGNIHHIGSHPGYSKHLFNRTI